ncbi:MAG: winged helix-turn-helix domain-containing protein [Halobacteriales archaeon]
MTEPEADELSPSEAFSLVANDTRFAILQALWDAGNDDADPVAFSELRERAGVRDSGQFNYHLDQLTPRFVRPLADGYELTYAGEQVVGAAVSGVYTEADAYEVEPMPVGTCQACGGTIEGGYRRGHIAIECVDCEAVFTNLPAPPVLAAGYDADALPLVFSRRLLTAITTLNRGFCELCGGRVDRSVAESWLERDDEDPLGIEYTCRACGRTVHAVVGAALLDHPAVVSFLFDHGVDLRETPVWELEWLYDTNPRLASDDPRRFAVSVAVDGDAVELTLDGDLAVLDWSRTGADAGER